MNCTDLRRAVVNAAIEWELSRSQEYTEKNRADTALLQATWNLIRSRCKTPPPKVTP